MRCLYCHNPDTWAVGRGTPMTAGELISEVEKVREFLKNGGITVSGGEPMLQQEFVTELFTQAKAHGFHTALDTSGILFDPKAPEKVDPLLDVEELYGTGFEPKPECLFGPKEELEKNGYKLHHQYQIPVTIAWNDAEKTACGNAEIVQLQGQSQADRMEEAFALLLKGGLKR